MSLFSLLIVINFGDNDGCDSKERRRQLSPEEQQSKNKTKQNDSKAKQKFPVKSP